MQEVTLSVIEQRQKNLTVTASPFQQITLNQLGNSQKLLEKANKKKWGVFTHSWIFYLLSWGILAMYAGKACPIIDPDFIFSFFDSLLMQVALLLFITIFPLYIIRLSVCRFIGVPTILRWHTVFYICFESIFFVLWGMILLVIGLYFGLHLESILKLSLGAFMFGFFSVFNLSLLRTRHRVLAGQYMKTIGVAESNMFVSIQFKFIVLATIILILVGIVTALTSLKNFHWLLNSMDEILTDTNIAILSVFKEILFIIGIFIGWMVITIYIYSTNVKITFVLFNNVIYNIFSNNFQDLQIPVLNDEFGVMGENIGMITEELKEKHKIKSTFGKFVSPKIADIILKDESTFERKGVAREIVVLFTDIRNFTNTTHSKDPHDLVDNLNEYFTDMVHIVEEHEGLVDKFIGDALMVLFGYDNIKKGINNAVYAAINMLQHLKKTNSDFFIGVGIGFGQAIVGLVGSPERLDFTAIGDVVNLSSRLESATKTLQVDILINEAVFNALYLDLKKLPWKQFKISVKGIDEEIVAYGLKQKK